jgi:hypothetical protein
VSPQPTVEVYGLALQLQTFVYDGRDSENTSKWRNGSRAAACNLKYLFWGSKTHVLNLKDLFDELPREFLASRHYSEGEQKAILGALGRIFLQ